jgi:transposase
MNNQQTVNTSQASGEQVAAKKYSVIKLALDTHADTVVVVQQIEHSQLQPPQRMSGKQFLAWVDKPLSQAQRVVSCYEAGPTGFWLHRQLVARGVDNLVVCPTCLDSRRKGVNTDRTDALELGVRLDRYVAGNAQSFSVVRVPTVEQEERRAQSRQREQLRRERLRLAAQGRTAMLLQGIRQNNSWWKPENWRGLQERLDPALVKRLAVYRRLILEVDKEIDQLTEAITQPAVMPQPKGLGQLTHQILEREVGAWDRFRNWRQVGSYCGLTGGVSASGESRADLSVTKAGNRRLRTALIELAWRMVAYQPEYWLVKKWRHVLLNPKAHTRRRKQAIVAFARQLMVDLWRWKTGRTTPEQLGWHMLS